MHGNNETAASGEKRVRRCSSLMNNANRETTIMQVLNNEALDERLAFGLLGPASLISGPDLQQAWASK